MSPARNQQQSTFPGLPPSLSAGDGMRDDYTAKKSDTQRQAPHTLTGITPYLGLRARLSQVWINKWTVLLLLVLARTLIAITGLHRDLDSAKREALAACNGVESMGSAMASMPHYMSAGVNDLAATGVEKAVSGLMSMLMLTVTGVEEIVVFYINMLTQTYLCLITFAVTGSLHAVLAAAEDATKFLNKTLGGIGKGIEDGISGFQNDLNKFTSGLNSLPFQGLHIPQLDVTNQITALNNVQLPASIDQGLQDVNKSIPNWDQVNNFTQTALRLPFEDLKKLLNDSIHFTFDRSVFPVPQKEQLTFCSDNNGINDFFDMLYNVAEIARKIFIAVLVIAAILSCIPMTYREIRRWRTIQQRAVLVSESALDPLDVVYIASRPYTSSAGMSVARRFQSNRKQILTRWVFAYGTSVPALFVLALALAGLFSCLCQYILLRAITKEVPALAAEVGDFTGKVVTTLNNASEQWAIGTNGVIISTNDKINQDVFGWVNVSTHAINETLNVFVNTTMDVLNTTFGGTILYDPILEVFNCLVGMKVAGIEKGLTWVSDHAHIDFPLFPNDTFSKGAQKALAPTSNGTSVNATESILASPGSEAADKITGAVDRVVNAIADGIRTEAIISTTILLIWVSIVLGGFFRALYLGAKQEKVRGVGGATYAGDIPLQNPPPHPPRPMSEAPAYEPPAPDSTYAGPFAAFREPLGVRRAKGGDADAWTTEQKVGYAGERGPGRIEGHGHVRGSSYGVLGNEKR